MAPKVTKDGQKRKRVSDTNGKPKKRARSESEDESITDDPQAEILLLEEQILESKKHYNNIAKLIATAKSFVNNSDSAALASVALTRVFVRLLSSGSLTKKKDQSEKEAVVVQWLRDRYFEYKDVLLDLIKEDELGAPALTLAMRSLKTEGQCLNDGDEYSFPHVFLRQIVQALLDSDSEDARCEFVDSFLTEFDDVRFYALRALK